MSAFAQILDRAAGVLWPGAENHAILAARSLIRGNGISWVILGAIGVFVIIGLWMLSRWWLGQGSPGTRNSPRALFMELCRVHGLAASDRQLLLVLAETNQLVQPSDLFVDPTFFDEGRVPQNLAGRRADIAGLRARLFAGVVQSIEQSGEHAAENAPSVEVLTPDAATAT